MKFFTAKQNEEIEGKLEAAETENDSLRAELENAQAKVTELTGLAEVNAQLQGDLSNLQTKLAEFEAKATEDAKKIVELTADAEVTAEKVSVRAAELLATQGHPSPVNLTGDDGQAGAKTKTRAEIDNLKPTEVKAFIKSGGKITD